MRRHALPAPDRRQTARVGGGDRERADASRDPAPQLTRVCLLYTSDAADDGC
ncbi:hypothetical protein FRIG_02695 [Frigoribacterium faeni]|nr:hypothetical protein [Frigoribacterium faeni]MCJ0700045.1 hypothetical protein [Frigoribacterium faeni]